MTWLAKNVCREPKVLKIKILMSPDGTCFFVALLVAALCDLSDVAGIKNANVNVRNHGEIDNCNWSNLLQIIDLVTYNFEVKSNWF